MLFAILHADLYSMGLLLRTLLASLTLPDPILGAALLIANGQRL